MWKWIANKNKRSVTIYDDAFFVSKNITAALVLSYLIDRQIEVISGTIAPDKVIDGVPYFWVQPSEWANTHVSPKQLAHSLKKLEGYVSVEKDVGGPNIVVRRLYSVNLDKFMEAIAINDNQV